MNSSDVFSSQVEAVLRSHEDSPKIRCQVTRLFFSTFKGIFVFPYDSLKGRLFILIIRLIITSTGPSYLALVQDRGTL